MDDINFLAPNWEIVAKAWQRRWRALHDKFNLNATANKKLRARITELEKELRHCRRLRRIEKWMK